MSSENPSLLPAERGTRPIPATPRIRAGPRGAGARAVRDEQPQRRLGGRPHRLGGAEQGAALVVDRGGGRGGRRLARGHRHSLSGRHRRRRLGREQLGHWAWDITNFVFWIGIGHAGTMIAAVLYLTRQKWASGINRAAEAMTIFAVMCAGIYPAIHVGRAWFAWYLAPIPNANAICPISAARSSGTSSPSRPTSRLDHVLVRRPDPRRRRHARPVKHKIGKYFYAVICLGWRGSARQWVNYEFCYLMLAGIATLLVITTCTVVSSDFSTSVIPGWHGTIFIPYFGVGAIYGGFCMLIILLVPIRQYYKLQDLVTLRHIDMCCRFTLLMGLFVAYIYGMEFFIAYYGGNPNERYTFYDRIRGPYWLTWYAMMFCNCVVPQLFWMKSVRRNAWLAFFVVPLPQRRGCGWSGSSSSSAPSTAISSPPPGACSTRPGSTSSPSRHLRRFLPHVSPLRPVHPGDRDFRGAKRPARGESPFAHLSERSAP